MLTDCPQCGYSLAGLPGDHRCPECGLHYDAESTSYAHTHPKAMFGGLIGFIGGLGGLVNAVRYYPRMPSWARPLVLLALLAFVVVMGWVTYVIFRLYQKGPLVAIVPDGLILRLACPPGPPKPEGEVIPWTNISRAAANQRRRSVALFIKDAKFVRDIVGVFRSAEESEAFATEVNRRILAVTQRDPCAPVSQV